jgi:hypothetical protein
VFVSQVVRNNKTLYANADNLTQLIETSYPAFRKILGLPSAVKFRLCTFKGSVRGQYQNDTKTIMIHVSKVHWNSTSAFRYMLTIAHEMIHAQQFYSGILKHVKTRKGYRLAWNGDIGTKGTTRNAYLNQPWEKEAFGRQEEVANQVFNILSNS